MVWYDGMVRIAITHFLIWFHTYVVDVFQLEVCYSNNWQVFLHMLAKLQTGSNW